jgi:hypothetical protein
LGAEAQLLEGEMEAEPQLLLEEGAEEAEPGGVYVHATARATASPREDSALQSWQIHVKTDGGVVSIEIEPEATCAEVTSLCPCQPSAQPSDAATSCSPALTSRFPQSLRQRVRGDRSR